MHLARTVLLALGVAATASAIGCASEEQDEPLQATESELNGAASNVSCRESTDRAYNAGRATTIKVITISGKKISKTTGHAFLKMQAAAKKAGVKVGLTSGFRTNAEQQYLYNCYRTRRCNGGSLAARPGFSNHQNGLAIDVTTSAWLAANAPKYGFVRTVPSEPWHWEYRGKDPGGPCTKEDEMTRTADAGAASETAPGESDEREPAEGADSPTTVADRNDDGSDVEDEDEPARSEDESDDEGAPTRRTREPMTQTGCAATGASTRSGAAAGLGLVAVMFVVARRRRRDAARGGA